MVGPRAAVVAAGIAYGVVGLAFSAADRAASTSEIRFGWRLAAWIVSGVVFAAHIAYAHLQARLRPSPAATALQASLGVALGAFVLAVAATVHAVWVGAGNRSAFGLALVVWPAVTAVPAFVAALVAAAGLTLIRRRVRRRPG